MKKPIALFRSGVAAFAVIAVAGTAMPVAAQDSEGRIRKLEAEVRALQRQVFPGGDGRFFTPEIVAEPTGSASDATPAPGVMTGLLGRIDALEQQIASLTAQSEENSNAIAVLTQRFADFEAMNAATGTTVAVTNATPVPATQTATPSTTPASMTTTSSSPAVATNVAAPSPQRLAAVQAITKPDSGDAGDDEYSYGFRLWNAGFYPEAQQQLRLFVDRYPNHWRTTYGRNLLGRAYMDDGKPREAAPWFLQNYQADKQAARAGDSLLYLAEAMIAIEDNDRACIALAEFGETYPALAAGRLQDQYESNRRKVSCDS